MLDNKGDRHELKEIRLSLGYTQVQMSIALGLHPGSYQEIESGRASCRKLHILAARYLLLTKDKKNNGKRRSTR